MITHARAPGRVLDIGGWTDTPYAEHGVALGCATDDGVHLVVRDQQHAKVTVQCSRLFPVPLQSLAAEICQTAARHFTVNAVDIVLAGEGEHAVGWDAVAGIALAVVGALAAHAGHCLSPHQLALLAHEFVCDGSRQACGMHEFLTVAFGGITLCRVSPYPRVYVTPLVMPAATLQALGNQLFTVPIPHPPASNPSQQVAMLCRGRSRRAREVLWQLRALPGQAVAALQQGDFPALGAVMQAQQVLWRRLLPRWFTPEVQHLQMLAYLHGAHGVQFDGSGSRLTMLMPPDAGEKVCGAMQSAGFAPRALCLATVGLRVWSELTADAGVEPSFLRDAERCV